MNIQTEKVIIYHLFWFLRQRNRFFPRFWRNFPKNDAVQCFPGKQKEKWKDKKAPAFRNAETPAKTRSINILSPVKGGLFCQGVIGTG
jgi:hypothetical protein